MADYRCYLLTNDHIVGVEKIEAIDDDAALLRAGEILFTRSYSAAEVWCGSRQVALIGKPPESTAA